MFHEKFVTIVKVQLVAKTQIIITNLNVNVAIRSNIIEK